MSKHTQRGRHRAAAFHQTMPKSGNDAWAQEAAILMVNRAIIVKRLIELGAKDIHPITGEPLDGE